VGGFFMGALGCQDFLGHFYKFDQDDQAIDWDKPKSGSKSHMLHVCCAF